MDDIDHFLMILYQLVLYKQFLSSMEYNKYDPFWLKYYLLLIK